MSTSNFHKLDGNAARTRRGQQAEPLQAALLPAQAAVILKASSWEGVSVHEHRFGGTEFRLGRRELGHLHRLFADLPFPRHIRNELIASGRAKPHHVLPDSGWVTAPMRTASEGDNVIGLLRQNYERAASHRRSGHRVTQTS